ncbi:MULTISPECIES: lactonase family protein [unclassified Nocardia]|uniref:lactonase family protein n=1 Tax=unclassified Nocardia TaxID=2637762 RepID=UPI001CE477F4|nr:MULTISPECIES: lactonase family protein [unclassified Nocardia]
MRNGDIGRRQFLGILGGALSVGAGVAAGVLTPPPARAVDGMLAYLGCYTSAGAGGRGIGVAAVDPATGGLTIADTVDGVADPSFLALSPDGRYLYAVDESTGAGRATALCLDTDRPTVLNTVAVQGNGPTHLCVTPDGRWVLTANYDSGSVSMLAVAEDGRLGAVTDVAQHSGSGPDPERQEGPHAHQVLVDPSGQWVLAVDLGVDSVYVYRLTDGKLTRHAQVAMTPGSGPRHLAFHPDGRRAYLANELNSTVTVCDWSPETGELRPGDSVVADSDTGGDRNYPSEPVISPDGRFLYLANRGHDNIATFALLGAAPVLLTTTPCGGKFPRHLTLSPDARRLYAANQKSDSVTWLDLDPITGIPGPSSGTLQTPAATCVVFR